MKAVLNNTKVYAGRLKNVDDLRNSSSGGAFRALSDVFLERGDAVICAVYNYSSHVTEFRLVFDKASRNAACGSKYMQSEPGEIFRKAILWLRENPEKQLLFIGLGCQAEGFRKFIEISGMSDRVWIVDIICHGVPSPKIWRDYVVFLEKKYNGCISELTFKDKRNGWKHPTAKVIINNCEVFIQEYVRLFYSSCTMRPSCHECHFAKIERDTDITIGDYWGIENKMPNFYSENGNSLFLIHTLKGQDFFDKAKKQLFYKESNTKDCLQPNLEKPTPCSSHRIEFWRNYQNKGIHYVIKRYGMISLQARIKNKLSNLIRGGDS